MLPLHGHLLLLLLAWYSLCRHPQAHCVGQCAPTGCMPAKYKAWGAFKAVGSASCRLQEAMSLYAGNAYRLRPKRVCTLTILARKI